MHAVKKSFGFHHTVHLKLVNAQGKHGFATTRKNVTCWTVILQRFFQRSPSKTLALSCESETFLLKKMGDVVFILKISIK